MLKQGMFSLRHSLTKDLQRSCDLCGPSPGDRYCVTYNTVFCVWLLYMCTCRWNMTCVPLIAADVCVKYTCGRNQNLLIKISFNQPSVNMYNKEFGYFYKVNAKTINGLYALLSCRWLTYMIQIEDLLKLARASGLQIWILPFGCHKMMTQF